MKVACSDKCMESRQVRAACATPKEPRCGASARSATQPLVHAACCTRIGRLGQRAATRDPLQRAHDTPTRDDTDATRTSDRRTHRSCSAALALPALTRRRRVRQIGRRRRRRRHVEHLPIRRIQCAAKHASSAPGSRQPAQPGGVLRHHHRRSQRRQNRDGGT